MARGRGFFRRLLDTVRGAPEPEFTPEPAAPRKRGGFFRRLFRGEPKPRRREPRRGEPRRPVDLLGRDLPDYSITRWTAGQGWEDGPPDESTLRRHIGDPDFMITVHFPSLDSDPDLDAYYNMVAGFEDWDEFEVAVVDMYMDYTG